jgi:hypothetical protein
MRTWSAFGSCHWQRGFLFRRSRPRRALLPRLLAPPCCPCAYSRRNWALIPYVGITVLVFLRASRVCRRDTLEWQLAAIRCPARVSPAASLAGYSMRSSKPASSPPREWRAASSRARRLLPRVSSISRRSPATPRVSKNMLPGPRVSSWTLTGRSERELAELTGRTCLMLTSYLRAWGIGPCKLGWKIRRKQERRHDLTYVRALSRT